jgi:hypothetical protein
MKQDKLQQAFDKIHERVMETINSLEAKELNYTKGLLYAMQIINNIMVEERKTYNIAKETQTISKTERVGNIVPNRLK